MKPLLLVVLLVVCVGCGDSPPRDAAPNPNGPRPIPGGVKPAENKTEWDATKPKNAGK